MKGLVSLKTLAIPVMAFALALPTFAQKKNADAAKEPKDPINSGVISGLKFRNVGPATTSGRVADFAVHPQNHKVYYVAAASGGVWKTENAGNTFEPIGDTISSYSMGCITLDPNNPNTVWLGTGENNNQRSVGYGNGVYKSVNGGKGWIHCGLQNSEHIAKIIVDPRNSDVVYVAAVGPLWNSGGDRGLYKTTDGGKTWTAVLTIDANTGVTDLVMDPRNPDVLIASAYQRRRHVWTYIGGGPSSGLHKTTDGGKTWRKITEGIPGGEIGRIGLAISPVNPDYVYAVVEAEDGKGGFFRSTDRGESFSKMGGKFTSGNYYQEIIADPIYRDRVYLMDTYGAVTDDGGKTWRNIGNKARHVDDHAFWINPNDAEHVRIGCDGGIYESWNGGATWDFKENLPITQFYKVAVDNSEPVYHIYGGTQDNFSLGGPSRTLNASGIANSDWFITQGGDGFESAIDPLDPDIAYAQYQYGGLIRYDRTSGEQVDIRPMPKADEPAWRWNWDAPLLISPHNNKRLYFCANKVFRSDDRGNTWQTISPDLSRQLDRNQLAVMDKVWSMDAVAKNKSTSIYGNITAFDESPKKEGLLYAGTDDGLIHISNDNGATWRKVDGIAGVPERTYVNAIVTSVHDANTAYAVFNNHKNGDFKPYIFKTTDAGNTWKAIQGNLPVRGTVYDIAEDHEKADLLFAGTEFGFFATVDGGVKWIQVKGGLPIVAIKDIEIQRRENDIVVASFGRGFFVLDDYSPLRQLQKEMLDKEGHIFPIKKAPMFIERTPLGLPGKGFHGESYYLAPNPPFGATFTYYVKESPKSIKEKRQEAEKAAAEKGEKIMYPSAEALRAEDHEAASYLLFEIRDSNGEVVRRLTASNGTGMQRISWDLRAHSFSPVRLGGGGGGDDFFSNPDGGHLVAPGKYNITLFQVQGSEITRLAGPTDFEARPLVQNKLAANDPVALQAFYDKVTKLWRAGQGASRALGELQNRHKLLQAAVLQTPGASTTLLKDLAEVDAKLTEMNRLLEGDNSLVNREFEVNPSINTRIGEVMYGLWTTTADPTTTQRNSYEIAYGQLKEQLVRLREVDTKLAELENAIEKAGGPWTPGRIPNLD